MVFGERDVDVDKAKEKLTLPSRKKQQARRLIDDIIANGGVKTFQLDNF